MRRMFAVAVGTVLVVAVGAGTAAWAAGPGRGDPVKREAAKACIEAARAANPDAGDGGADGRAAVREAARPCLEAAGITPRELTPEQQARRDALRTCVKSAREADPEAERPALREAVKSCLAEAGITPRDGPRARLRQCIEQARTASPDADRATLAPIVRECVAQGG
ncbi:MAG TPA: hypothetical protein VM942_08355 [Acidimicrobiales bacterium]|nr:hypothetical protein [Acidimicrobiales bacterium]